MVKLITYGTRITSAITVAYYQCLSVTYGSETRTCQWSNSLMGQNNGLSDRVGWYKAWWFCIYLWCHGEMFTFQAEEYIYILECLFRVVLLIRIKWQVFMTGNLALSNSFRQVSTYGTIDITYDPLLPPQLRRVSRRSADAVSHKKGQDEWNLMHKTIVDNTWQKTTHSTARARLGREASHWTTIESFNIGTWMVY